MSASARLKSIRAGHRRAIYRFLRTFDEIKEQEIDSADVNRLSNSLDALNKKQDVLRKLDEDIVKQLDDENIETEVANTNEYAFNLE